MKKAWIENGKIRDIANGNPDDLFHPDIAVHYDTDIEDLTEVGAELVNGKWVNPIPSVIIEAAVILPLLSPVEFKLLFTGEERVAIKASSDLLVQDFFELLNDLIADPRMPHVDRNLASVSDAVKYLEFIKLIAVGRAAEILS